MKKTTDITLYRGERLFVVARAPSAWSTPQLVIDDVRIE
jgi:hypothetical protein